MNQDYTFSVIMACYNESKHIAACLDSIIAQDFHFAQVEVLVYDGNSSDGTKDILTTYASKHPNIIVADNPMRIASAGWNIGWMQANGEYFLLMGAHTILAPNYLTLCLQELKAHPEAIAVGGRVHPIAGVSYWQKLIGIALHSPFGVGNASYRYSDKCEYVETLNYAAYRQEVRDTVGYFLPWLRRNDDWEYNYRITKLGYKLYYNPAIISYYIPRANLGKFAKQQFLTGDWKWEIIKMHPKSLLFRHVMPSIAVLLGLVLGIWGFSNYTAAIILLLLVIIYILVSLILNSKVSFAQKLGLLVVFIVMHLSYGLGFLGGIRRLFIKSGGNVG